MPYNAYDLVPHQIIEVEPNIASAFFGRIEDPKPSTTLENTNRPIIDESAFRIIMYKCFDKRFGILPSNILSRANSG